MRCPICDGADVVHATRDVPYTYKNEVTTIPEVTGDFCDACGEYLLDPKESKRVSKIMVAHNKEVNARAVNPSFIVQVREKLDLDQQEAAEIFGGGPNAFSRYENGRTKPGLALIKLLKLLDKHPELLPEVKAA
jgi:HTH-type transcriptional regulator/antitoxin MqsA